jgi:hypothetical protein
MKLNIWKTLTPAERPTPVELGDLLANREIGAPLTSDALEMIPIFGSEVAPGEFALPEDAIVLKRVRAYGTMVLANQADRPAIVPLHLGYLQKDAQNHAMCTGAILDPNEEKTFTDACCVQQGQGGLMTEQESRFIVLPHPLRARAFALRGQPGYSKLWTAISSLNRMLGLKVRGHLDALKHAHQPDLVRTLHQLEHQPDQTGAVFAFQGRIIGIELAPDPAFWRQIHVPLVMYAYAPLKLIPEMAAGLVPRRIAIDVEGARSILELQRRLAAAHEARKIDAAKRLAACASQPLTTTGDARSGVDRLLSIDSDTFAGQIVVRDGAVAYASVFQKTDLSISA